MKKMLSALLLCGVVLGATLTPALAENYRYKLYDPINNKSYTVQMITYGASEHTYFVGLADNSHVCAIIGDTNTNAQGLIGGTCYNEGRKYGWRELQRNTYMSEVSSIIRERKSQGQYLVNSAEEAQAIETKLRRNNNSGLRDALWEATN
ncbi:MAG: hypothetical protein NC200_00880 [Candidatus Gastranaerophilales bacterium]|nr:hypothetical protein [Candidatus Gastranaerophilales bacterium]MCM1338884.1 hypothetical protein [Muribaculaceae bacterium]